MTICLANHPEVRKADTDAAIKSTVQHILWGENDEWSYKIP
jgi:hypothetical protein